jgi:two-component system CitB family sensor kinase
MNAVTRIGGTVEVEVDGGTRFTVTLPTAVAAEVGG